ncbi:tetratricopeptide repeat protein [Kitasatospora purpeofusca]|uniref:tetratricopeptide repeat protein n=1 Tax=Kitasatospora purpeofusca TaxID=67352 RepID=UPI003F4AE35E
MAIPPALVERLLELGHEEEVRYQAGRGEWRCAQGLVRLFGERGLRTQALEVLAPYVAAGWWPAVETQVELLEGWGRAEEAIALCRRYARSGESPALGVLGQLLGRHGRADEAFTLLRDGVEDWFLAAALVDVAGAAGEDDAAAALLADRIEAAVPLWGGLVIEPFNAVDLLAVIHERQGRIDEAIALLHAHGFALVKGRDRLADLLARHDWIDELRAYAATGPHGLAAQCLAEVLEERGDVGAAVAAYRTIGEQDGMSHVAVPLARLLERHGRGAEAIEVMRELAEGPDGLEDWIVEFLCTLYADQGRPREGLAHLDAVKERRAREDWDFFRMRLPLIAACGLPDKAIELARAHPEGDTWYAADEIARMLTAAGRPDEARAVLEPHIASTPTRLAEHLIDAGRIKDAIAALQRPPKDPVDSPWTTTVHSGDWVSTAPPL